MYAELFHFPTFEYQLTFPVVLTAVAVSLAAALLGAWGAISIAMQLPPAEAMRPEAPAQYRTTTLERLGLGRLVTSG